MFRFFFRLGISVVSLLILMWFSADAYSQIRFKHHFGERNLGGDAWGQTALIDVDVDGDLDIVRSNIWFENHGKGRTWTSHRMTKPWGGTSQPWEKNATQTRTVDIDEDRHLDVVIADGENRKARIAWLEAPDDPKTGQWKTHFLPRNDPAARGAFHSLQIGDFNGNGKLDIFTVEMESVPGDKAPRWFLWENLGSGRFKEHVILDANLGGHEAVAGDVDGDGDLDICAKPWRASKTNANGGRVHFDYLENLSK